MTNRRDFILGILTTASYALLAPQTMSGFRSPVKPTFNWDEAYRKALEGTIQQLIDNITKPDPFWVFLKQKGYISEISNTHTPARDWI